FVIAAIAAHQAQFRLVALCGQHLLQHACLSSCIFSFFLSFFSSFVCFQPAFNSSRMRALLFLSLKRKLALIMIMVMITYLFMAALIIQFLVGCVFLGLSGAMHAYFQYAMHLLLMQKIENT